MIRLLLDQDGYWTRQSQKVNLTREEKAQIGKPSIPRPEIDVIAFRPKTNEIIAMEVKSFLDSRSVSLDDLRQEFDIPTGRYKLFICQNYRSVVFSRLLADLIDLGLANAQTKIRLGLAAGKIRAGGKAGMAALFRDRGWVFLQWRKNCA